MNFKQTLILVILLITLSLTSNANHVLGGHFSYTCLGGNQYGLTLTYYSDCFGATDSPPIQLINLTTLDGCADYSYFLNFVSETEISDLCPSELPFSSCNSGIIPGTYEIVYYNEITLDPTCSWNILWSGGDYNYFANVDNTNLNQVYFTIDIDPSIPCEETLDVTSMNVPFYCSGDPVSHQLSFNNPQGYDLSYAFTDVLANGGALIPGYFDIPGIAIDPLTGEITFTAPVTAVNQSYVVGVEVTMSSAGSIVGTYTEYMSFIIRNCSSPPTVFSSPAVFDQNEEVNFISESHLQACVGDSLCFYISAENSNIFSAVSLTPNLGGTPFASAQFTVDGVNPAIGHFCTLVTPSMEGTTVLTFDAINSACVNPTSSSFDVTIDISPYMSSNVMDSTVCVNSILDINIAGSSDVNWNVISGTDPGFIQGNASQTFTATENLQIEINSNDPNALAFCNVQDTINIDVALSGITANITGETCAQDDGAIDLTVGNGSGNYVYLWTPGNLTTQDITNQAGGMYNVVVTDLDYTNCSTNIDFLIDSVIPPSGSISSDTTICSGDCYDITFNLSGVGPFDVELMNLSTNALEPVPSINNGDTFQVCPTTTTSYELQLISDSNNPACTSNPASSIQVTVRPDVIASLDPIAPVCDGDTVNIPIGINQTGFFSLNTTASANNVNLGDGNTVAFPVTAPSSQFCVNSIQYTDGPVCLNDNVVCIDIDANLPPTATILNENPSYCLDLDDPLNNTPTLDLQLTGTGNWLADLNNAPSGWLLDSNQINVPVSFPLADQDVQFCITHLEDLGTGCVNDNINECVTYDFNTFPTADITTLDQLPVCSGSSVELLMNITNPSNVYIEAQSSGVIDSLINVSGVQSLIVNPNQTETYQLSSVVELAGNCEVNNIDSVLVTVYESPDSIVVLDTICNPNGEDYQLIMQVLGGDSTTLATEILTTPGIFNGTYFTSNSIPSGQGADFGFNDGDPCPIGYTSGIITCPTLSNGGTITMDSVFCSNGQLCIDLLGDTLLDPNDVLNYIILSSDDINTATVLALSANNCWDISADFSFPPFEFNTTYYGFAVVGNDVGGGLIDPAQTNYYSNGVPFVIQEEPIISLTGDAAICQGDSTAITFNYNEIQSTTFDVLLDGAFVETLTNVNPPYEYYVSEGGIFTISNIATAHCPGSSTDQVEIIVNPIPTATISTDGAICFNTDYDFEINCTGQAPWTVDIQQPNNAIETVNVATSPQVYTNFLAGDYTIVNVTDNNGCSNDDTTSVASLIVYDLPQTFLPTLDTSYCSGSVLNYPVSLTGNGPWSIDYTVNGNPFNAVSLGNDTVIQLPLSEPGTVNIVAVSDIYCSRDINTAINVSEIETPIADAGVDIFGLCSGSTATIGTAENVNFDYLWTGDVSILESMADTTLAQPNILTTNTSGFDQNYTLTLTVSNGQCYDTDLLDVNIASAPNTDAGEDINLCLGDQATLNGLGGLCEWNEIGDSLNGTFVDISQVCMPIVGPIVTTSYSLTTTGANGCTANDTMTVFVSEAFVVDINFTEDVCFNTCDGQIAIAPQGGFGNYGVTWTNAPSLDSLTETGLCAGVYDFTVFDNNQVCSIDTSITINQLPFYQFDSLTVTNPTCFEGFNSTNGSIEVFSSSGADFFLDSTLDTDNDGLFDGLSNGDYLVEVVDSAGCVASQVVSLISDSPQLTVTPNFSNYIACYQEDVFMTANANGGINPYSYTWYNCFPDDNTCLFDSDGDNQATFAVLDSTAIYVIALDNLGCNSDTAMINLTLATPLEITTDIDPNIVMCQGDSLILQATPSGGNENYTIEWFENENSLGLDNNYIVSPMVNTTYTAQLTDGCSESVNFIINAIVNETPDVIISADNYSGCYPVTLHLSNQTNPNLIGGCTWNLGNGDSQAICADIDYTYTTPGVYSPSLTVVSPDGCLSIGYLPQPIVVSGYPTADFSWTPDDITPLENQAQFINESVGASLYSWNITGLLDSHDYEPEVVFPPDNVGDYEVCLIATSGVGCRDTICKTLDIKNEIIIYVPNAFTPDLDGINDFFKPVITGIDPTDYLFQIYDQWGILLFQTTDPEGFWRGDNRRGEYYVEPQTFNYVITVKDVEDGNEYRFTGTVTVIR